MSSFISIHAPTWGATRKHFRKCHYHHISIHAPTWGATNSISMVLQISTNFNPRTHVGCDFSVIYVLSAELYFNPRTHVGCDQVRQSLDFGLLISIHAPTWGATYSSLSSHESQSISIHAPTWGATVKPSNGWLLGHKDNEFANENIIIINSVNIT